MLHHIIHIYKAKEYIKVLHFDHIYKLKHVTQTWRKCYKLLISSHIHTDCVHPLTPCVDMQSLSEIPTKKSNWKRNQLLSVLFSAYSCISLLKKELLSFCCWTESLDLLLSRGHSLTRHKPTDTCVFFHWHFSFCVERCLFISRCKSTWARLMRWGEKPDGYNYPLYFFLHHNVSLNIFNYFCRWRSIHFFGVALHTISGS